MNECYIKWLTEYLKSIDLINKYYCIVYKNERSEIKYGVKWKMEIGDIIESTDPEILIRVVKGHPFFALKPEMNINDCVIFEVEPTSKHFEGDLNYCNCGFLCRSVRNIRIVTIDSPEFDTETLYKIAHWDHRDFVRRAVINLLDSEKDQEKLLEIVRHDESCENKKLALSKIDPKKCQKELLEILRNSNSGFTREIVIELLDPKKNQKEFLRTLYIDNNNVRLIALKKIDSKEYGQDILRIALFDKCGDMRILAIKKLDCKKYKKELIKIVSTSGECFRIKKAISDKIAKLK